MTWTPTESTTHEADAIGKLLSQFQPQPRIRSVVQAHAAETQKLEALAFEVSRKLNIEQGFGIILDNIGRLVGRGRNDLDDGEYRIGLRAQIRINKTDGGYQETLEILQLLLPGTWHVTEYPPLSSVVWREEALTLEQIDPIYQSLRVMRSAGVRLDFAALTDADSIWGLDDDPGADGGLWDLDDTPSGGSIWAFDQEAK